MVIFRKSFRRVSCNWLIFTQIDNYEMPINCVTSFMNALTYVLSGWRSLRLDELNPNFSIKRCWIVFVKVISPNQTHDETRYVGWGWDEFKLRLAHDETRCGTEKIKAWPDKTIFKENRDLPNNGGTTSFSQMTLSRKSFYQIYIYPKDSIDIYTE